MKVTVEPQEKAKEIKYPCLMMSKNGNLVFFVSYSKGILFKTDDSSYSANEIGEFMTRWDMSQFTPYNGKITLEND